MPSNTPAPRAPAPNATVFNLRQAFKLALSMVLFYWLALSMNWDVPQYGALAIILVSLDTSGATIEKGMMRFVGTTVGVLVGFLVLALFSHDRWALMLAFALYLALISYFMQASRYDYAWFVAAFVPLIVWANTYPRFESAFYFGIFRYLETTAGILIYTMIDLILWPRQAGDQLNEQGEQLWSNAREFFDNTRQQLAGADRTAGDSDLRAKLTASFKQLTSTLQNAYLDTPAVKARKPLWQTWTVQAGELIDALLGWQELADSIIALQNAELVPRFDAQMDVLKKRLQRISTLWQQWQEAGHVSYIEDIELLEPLEFDASGTAGLETRPPESSNMAGFVRQMKSLDEASRELLRTLRVLAGLDRHDISTVSLSSKHLARLFGWERERMIQSLFPPFTFAVAYLFWIFVNPPAGPKVPMLAGNLSLALLRTPMNLRAVLAVVLLILFLIVAPVYWLVMPTLTTGFGLLFLIFVVSFFFAFLGGRSPALKLGPLILFFSMTGISNQQAYSFNATVDAGIMVLVAGGITGVVYGFFKPSRPTSK